MVNPATPLRIGALIFPSFTGLDLSGPLQPLNRLSMTEPMTLSIISTTLDPVSIDRSIINGVVGGMGANSSSPYFTQYIVPTHTLEDAPHDLDVLLVPGGGGTRDLPTTQPHVDWLRDRLVNEPPKYLWTVCTGAALAARTGQLAGRNATTNKAAFNWVKTQEGADEVNWIAKARWVVDGNYWTSSGVSAGTDMLLGWIEHEYGRNESERMRIGMEWNALDQDDDPFAAEYGLVPDEDGNEEVSELATTFF